MQRNEEERRGGPAPGPQRQEVPPAEGGESRPGRRYGLFGVSAYPEKSRMGERQRADMSRLLGVVIGVMALAVVIVLFLTPMSSGLTVTFDALGGSAVESQSVRYGETLEEPGETVRPGYQLVGWSTAPEGEALWDFEANTVTETLTLYAVWAPDGPEA